MGKQHPIEMRRVLTEQSRAGMSSGDVLRHSQDFSAHSRHISDQSIPETPKEYIDRISEKLEYLTLNEQRFFYVIKERFNVPQEKGNFIPSLFQFLEKKMPEKFNHEELANNSLKEAWDNIIEREEFIKAQSHRISHRIEKLKRRWEQEESTTSQYYPLQITDKQKSRIQYYIKSGDMKPKHILDTDVSIDRYHEMSHAFANEQKLETQINYAIKSQSNTYLLQDLMRNGLAREKEAEQSRFGMDAASKGEIEKCIHAACTIGIDAKKICSRITLSNPNMVQDDMEYALDNGVRGFVVHNPLKLMLLHQIAKERGIEKEVEIITRIPGPPNAKKTGGDKFGADLNTCEAMLRFSHHVGMKPTGMAVHVGWQVDSAEKMEEGMDYALKTMAQTFENVKKHGIELSIVDLGGGWPNQFRGKPVPSINTNAKIVRKLMDQYFGDKKPSLILEPGNYLSAAAGVTLAKITNIDETPNKPGMLRCVLDSGMFNGGLVDGHYPVSMIIGGKTVEALVSISPHQESQYPAAIFGPSCDSSDLVIGDVMLSDNPEVRERFEQMNKANNISPEMLKKLDSIDNTQKQSYIDEIIQKAQPGSQVHIILHGTGAYTSEYNVGEVGKRGFNSIGNPELVILSQGRIIETGDHP
jgi:ornithine decarboxylase